MKNLVEKFPRCVRGNFTGLSDENDGHERLACAGIWNPLTTSVSIIKDIFNLQEKARNSVKKRGITIVIINWKTEDLFVICQ